MTQPPPPVRGPTPDEIAWQGTSLETATGTVRLEILANVHRGEAIYRGARQDTGARVLVRLATAKSGDAAFLARHARDAQKLEALSATTPSLGRAVAHGVVPSPAGLPTAFVVIEELPGRTLREQLDARAKSNAGASIAEALVIFAPVVQALAALQREGLAHRAFSPTSVTFAEIGGRAATTVTEVTLGADENAPGPEPVLSQPELRYGAPESFKKSYGATGPATDVFMFALTLVEFLSGTPAYLSADVTDLYLEATNLQKRPTPRARGVSSSDAVEAVFARALAVDPKRRYPDITTFFNALGEAVENRQSPVVASPSAMSALPTATEERRRERREKTLRRTFLFGLVPATFLVAMGVTLYARSHRTPSVPTPSAPPPSAAVDASPANANASDAMVGDSSTTETGGKDSGGDDSGADASPALDASVDSSSEAGSVSRPAEGSMVRVPAAAFPMGTDGETRAERPIHKVVLTKAFSIDALEVTVSAYEACIAAKACTPALVHFGAGSDPLQKGCNSGPGKASHPANCVDQLQSAAYCAHVGKRLPTEAEWELAARGTDARAYPWGDSAPKSCTQGILRGLAGACEKKLETFEVGLTPDGKSPFGAWDMSGNVWEWVADGYADYPGTEVTDPFTPPANGPDARGVLRGGSYDYAVPVAKTTSRLALLRTAGHVSTGFRCAKSINP